jgi:hypothetical protein
MSTQLKGALLLCATFLVCTDASAVGRTFVKSTGVDSNTASNCGPTTPCRTFGAALSVTDSGGEVVVLDSAGYGPSPINITQSVSITAPDGVYAGITVAAGDGIVINGSSIAVSLQGLRINGVGGANGINFAAGSELHIRNCAVSKMTSNGIQVTATPATIFINDVEVRDNGQSGILLSGAMTAILDRVRADANAYGVYADSGAVVDVRNSTASANTFGGGFNLAASSADTTLLVSKSASLRNVYGVLMVVSSPFHGYLTVESSVIEGNSFSGISDNEGAYGLSGSSGGGSMTVTDSKLTGNGGSPGGNAIYYDGSSGNAARSAMFARNVVDRNAPAGVVLAGTGTVATFEANVVTGNSTGISVASGAAYSRGDNTITGNTVNVFGTLTPLTGL